MLANSLVNKCIVSLLHQQKIWGHFPLTCSLLKMLKCQSFKLYMLNIDFLESQKRPVPCSLSLLKFIDLLIPSINFKKFTLPAFMQEKHTKNFIRWFTIKYGGISPKSLVTLQYTSKIHFHSYYTFYEAESSSHLSFLTSS